MVEVVRLVSDKNNEGAGSPIYIQTLGLPLFSYVAVTCHKCDLFYESVLKRALWYRPFSLNKSIF